jgi:hypothetical protein
MSNKKLQIRNSLAKESRGFWKILPLKNLGPTYNHMQEFHPGAKQTSIVKNLAKNEFRMTYSY